MRELRGFATARNPSFTDLEDVPFSFGKVQRAGSSSDVALADNGEHEKQVFGRVALSEQRGSLEHRHLMVGDVMRLADQIVAGELTPNLSPGWF